MSDMTDEEVQQYVADLVTSQMESQEFQLAPSQVSFPPHDHHKATECRGSGCAFLL